MEAVEIRNSIKKAREYALQGNYDGSLAFYTGLDREIADHIARTPNVALKSQWEEVRVRLQEEKRCIQDAMAEVKALINPAEAVRRDRGAVPRRGDSFEDGEPSHSSKPVGRPAGGGSPSGVQPYVMEFGLPAPVASVGGLNEAFFGDRDRFGPGFAPPPRSGNTPQRAPAVWNAKKQAASPVQHPTAAPSAPATGAKKDRLKPPLPRFGGKKPPPSGVTGGGNSGGGGVQKYVPRPGEEELAAAIESDMSTGSTNVSWDDVAGHAEAKRLLEEAVVYPVLMPEYFQGIRRPWRGVLMYGPPGTGKTMLAKAVASECGTTFFNISPATLTSKWRGDSEKMVRLLFEMARHYAPSTIFIDEIDSLCSQRGSEGEHEASRRAKSVLLTQMDGLGVDQSKIVMVLGATNHPWDIDEAMRRRLEQRIYTPLPEADDIVELLKISTKGIKLSDDVDFEALAQLAAGNNYSAHDLTVVVRDASMMTMRRFLDQQRKDRKELKKHAGEISKQVAEEPVTMADFVEAIRKVPSSVNAEQVKRFLAWKKEFETTG